MFDSRVFWKERWEKEQESYIPGPISLYKHNLKALKFLIEKHNLNFTEKRVLDVSCGKNFYSTFYKRLGAKVDCSDLSWWVVMRAKKKGFVSFIWDIGKDTPLPFKNSRYDFIHCTQTLVHLISDEEFQIGCQNLVRELRVGGFLIVGDRFLPDKKIDKPHIKYRTVSDYILALTKNNNMKLVDVVLSFPPGGRILLFCRRK